MNEPQKRKPGRPKAADKVQTMDQILRIASFQFMEHGFEKVSLEGVAKACGITKASVYYYYTNKAELFTACLVFVLSIAYESTKKLIQGPGSLRERLLVVAERHMANAHIDFETMMREASQGLNDEQIAKIRQAENALHLLLADVFQQAMDNNEIRPYNPLLLAHAYTAVMTVRNRKEVVSDSQSLKQSAEEIVDLLWNGLVPHV